MEGAEVHSTLDFVASLASLMRVQVRDTDNVDGFCLREQLYFDGVGSGINTQVGRLLRKAAK